MCYNKPRNRYITCYLSMVFAMSFIILFSLIWMERFPQNNVFFEGLGIHRIVNQKDKIRRPTTDILIPEQATKRSSEENSSVVNWHFRNISCSKLFNGVLTEVAKAKDFLTANNFTFKHRNNEDYDWMTMDCDNFKRSRGYVLESPIRPESDFPLAFNILFHQNVEQLERLLRVIYRPQNQYCIHVDRKTPENVLRSVEKIANCFENVFLASKLEAVVYSSYSRLVADINCMKDHIDRNKDWKYLLNFASSELPLRTNLELVEILTIFNGSNDIRETFLHLNKNRFKYKHFTHINLTEKSGHIIHTKEAKDAPPGGLTITKGNAYNVFSRAFVVFALQNRLAQELLDWSADTLTPDEHYWATLNNLYNNGFLKTPGGFEGHPDKKQYFARYIGWKSKNAQDRCIAKHYIHKICVFGVEDLPKLKTQTQLVANKFDIEYDPIAYSCMEEWLFNKTRNRVHINNDKLYRRLAFVPKKQ